MSALPSSFASMLTDLSDLFGAFTSERRLFELQGEGAIGELLIEAWSLRESFSQPWELTLSAGQSSVSLHVT